MAKNTKDNRGGIEKIADSLVKHKQSLKKDENGLNLRQEKFCLLYASDREFFGNGVESYSEAYDIDLSEPGNYGTCRANASKLLTKSNILNRINQLLEDGTLNDTFVDKQLAFLITQNADLPTKRASISEYNKLKQRITDKLDITTSGEKIIGYKLPRIDDDILPSKK